MNDSVVGAETPPGNRPNHKPGATPGGGRSLRSMRIVAIVAGLLGIMLTLSVPFLPVKQDTATITWTGGQNVEAPLVGYAPLTFDATIPCESVQSLAGTGGLLASTSPAGTPDAERYGFVAKVTAASDDAPGAAEVIFRNHAILSVPLDQLPAGCTIAINSDATSTTAEVTGSDRPVGRYDGDLRPQTVGIFGDIGQADGLEVNAELDTRFTTSPTVWKILAMVVGALATVVALYALHRLDDTDGRRSRRFLPTRWWSFTAADVVVLGTLVVWHFIGATTSDDGYQFTMARASEEAGYMANYFRYFGVPEAPFGSPYYDFFALLAHVTTASPWVRLPALICGIVAWLVISREVLPRLGAAAKSSKVALWTGGLVFLAFWLPYNNGLRPEPAVAVGVLLTWCSVERAIATRRLLPAAVAILVGAATLTAGPSGLICFAALVAGLRPLTKVVVERARTVGYWPLLLPLVASGTLVLVAVFADQGLATVFQMQHAHEIAGPNQHWYEEYLRYQWLFNASVDGSLARRFGVFAMVLCLAVCILTMMRKGGRIPGTSTGPSRRIVGITLGAMVLMMFTPTKWTHHFGVYAGLAGSLAVLATVAVSASTLRSHRNRALFAAAVSFLLAMCFTSVNGWWYVSSYGVPWFDKPVEVAGISAGSAFLGLTVLLLIAAIWYHVREPLGVVESKRSARFWAIPPLTIAAGIMVVFEVLSMAKGAVAQYPAFSIARSNIDAVTGQPCGLANDVLLEKDANASLLAPVSGDPATALGGADSTGFTPNGVAGDLEADKEETTSGTANSVRNQDNANSSSNTPAGTGGGSGNTGINGSSVALPFGLSPATTPVMGSFAPGEQTSAQLTSGWYQLPQAGPDGKRGALISIAAAGRIQSIDSQGVITPGLPLEVEYGVRQPDSAVTSLGSAIPMDIGPAPSWRNLRVPLDQLPQEADVVRLVASDTDRSPEQWLAFTPPRVPVTERLDDVVGSDSPVLLDWAVGLQFPCQRPFNHRNGIAEVPEYRILPDRAGAVSTNLWEDHSGGGPLGWIEMLLNSRTIPSYLENDWDRDWGEIEQYSPKDPGAVPADPTTGTAVRSGTWNPGQIATGF
ncbi:arabinosyltransferase domain-containing protein [Rhodococcus sp. NPDC058521]|uniref:arabinosyltransferase domain-containing protein n=1 Tax=Rhodococcus sp. NPDC058521 TaxID=3346536 RepID=UPI003655107A